MRPCMHGQYGDTLKKCCCVSVSGRHQWMAVMPLLLPTCCCVVPRSSDPFMQMSTMPWIHTFYGYMSSPYISTQSSGTCRNGRFQDPSVA